MRSIMVVTMEDVVVLPWVPAIATVVRPAESTGRISARVHTGIPSSRARTTSTLVAGMAVEMTTTSGETRSIVAGSWPTVTSMPARESSRT